MEDYMIASYGVNLDDDCHIHLRSVDEGCGITLDIRLDAPTAGALSLMLADMADRAYEQLVSRASRGASGEGPRLRGGAPCAAEAQTAPRNPAR